MFGTIRGHQKGIPKEKMANYQNAIFFRFVISFFYRTQVNLGSDSWVRMSVRNVWLDLTDVTLADEDTNSILTDNANRAMWQYK